MTKSDVAWVALRFIGLYLAIEAITSVVIIGLDFNALEKANEAMNRGLEVDNYLASTYGSIYSQTSNLVLYLLLSYYCLRKGAFLHKLLMFAKNEKET